MILFCIQYDDVFIKYIVLCHRSPQRRLLRCWVTNDNCVVTSMRSLNNNYIHK